MPLLFIVFLKGLRKPGILATRQQPSFDGHQSTLVRVRKFIISGSRIGLCGVLPDATVYGSTYYVLDLSVCDQGYRKPELYMYMDYCCTENT